MQLPTNDLSLASNICKMTKDEKYRKYCDDRMAQQIRENSQELRQLETKIRAAYVNKALRAQLVEQQKCQLQKKLRLQNEIEQMKQHEQIEKQKERKSKEEMREKQRTHRIELQQQIIDQRTKRKRLYEEFLKEKIIIDEIIAQIQKEQIEEMHEKLRKSMCLREDINRLMCEQEKWKAEQKFLVAEENKRIEQFIAQQDDRIHRIKENQQAKQQAEIDRQEKMCAYLDEIERKKLEREELLIDLKCKELNDKQMLLDRKQLEQSIRQRLQTKLQLDDQMRDLKMRRLQQEAEDNLFREQQLQLFAEQDRLELLSNEKRRQKKLEHHRVVREMIEEREAKRNAEFVELMQQHQDFVALEKRRQEIFVRERMNILKKHADNLMGFLPPELLRDASMS